MSKIYIDSYSALMEHRILPETEMEYRLDKSDIIVNPLSNSMTNKLIILNLPIDILPIESLLMSNKVISRFDTGYKGIEVIPYTMPEQKEITIEDYSDLILTQSMFLDLNKAEMLNKSNFLVGVGELIDGDATLIGYKVGSTKLHVDTVEQGSQP